MSRLFFGVSMDSIVEALAVRRKQAGLSQEKLAQIAGMSAKTYQRIERGESDLKLSQLRSIMRTLDMTLLDMSLDELGVRQVEANDLIATARLLSPEAKLLLIQFLHQVTKKSLTKD